MNDGEMTPQQAARSLGVVRLVSFGAASALAALALISVMMTRYAVRWPDTLSPVVVVSEMARPPPRPTPSVAPERARPVAQVDASQATQPDASETPPPAESTAALAVITNPVWLRRPRNPARFYPRAAFIEGVEGEAVLDCVVEVSGRLECVVETETPVGRGFGDAALAIAAAHVMQPALLNGSPVRARYRMIVPFSTSG